jgi:hypothetical protein
LLAVSKNQLRITGATFDFLAEDDFQFGIVVAGVFNPIAASGAVLLGFPSGFKT